MNMIVRKQNLQVINTYNDSEIIKKYPIDDIKVINGIDKVFMIIENEDGTITDILNNMNFVGNYNDNEVNITFREYVLDNINLFDKKIIDVVLDGDNYSEVSFDVNEFFRCYDNLRNKVINPLDKKIDTLEDGTIIEKIISSCDRTSILDKLLSLGGISEDAIISLICDIDIEFSSVKTIVKDISGEVLSESFIIKAEEVVIIDDSCQLYYLIDSSLGLVKKPILCQSDVDNYKDYDFIESYGNVLKINLEIEKNKYMIYK